jgi:hypothetical protein
MIDRILYVCGEHETLLDIAMALCLIWVVLHQLIPVIKKDRVKFTSEEEKEIKRQYESLIYPDHENIWTEPEISYKEKLKAYEALPKNVRRQIERPESPGIIIFLRICRIIRNIFFFWAGVKITGYIAEAIVKKIKEIK